LNTKRTISEIQNNRVRVALRENGGWQFGGFRQLLLFERPLHESQEQAQASLYYTQEGNYSILGHNYQVYAAMSLFARGL